MSAANKPRTVLVVDDDEDVRRLLTHLLSKEGFDVRQAANGVEAILMLEESQPSVILVDLLMPGILGGSVVDYIRATPSLKRSKVAIVTGSPELAPEGYRVFKKPAAFKPILQFVQDTSADPEIGADEEPRRVGAAGRSTAASDRLRRR